MSYVSGNSLQILQIAGFSLESVINYSQKKLERRVSVKIVYGR